ncbi:hypothetical protein J2Z35_000342 [Acetoanaerobium pronyense]|uniref:Spo0E like sporulation regulatory protein n=1 Tax=Acetoanaerobium pronyense TaxID=1482736 RepID=A0ABS4KFK1_9FIRM|nr:aspartyl-phosphate phosphatase Spo0E family protein [Acetoanaerobium pronyense]MBP2026553.1 hypothetical protein [Acetoanaerobium pronyense]
MLGKEYEWLKEEIDMLRGELNLYVNYREIYKEEILKLSQKLDLLIVKHMRLEREALIKNK